VSVRKRWLPLAIIPVAAVATYAFLVARSSRAELPPELHFVMELHPRISNFASAENGRLYPSTAFVLEVEGQSIAHRIKGAFAGNPGWNLTFTDAASYSARMEKFPLRPAGPFPWQQGAVEAIFFDQGGTNTAIQITDYTRSLNPLQAWLYRLTHHM
jgi:hypothetical protein